MSSTAHSTPALGLPALPVALSRKAKAAIVVRLLLSDGADIPLEDLPDSLQASLTQQMGSMHSVDRATLLAVVSEFAQELDRIGLSFPNGMADALDALEGTISAQTAARLRKEAGVRQAGDPWARIKAQSMETLLLILETESIEVAAVMLAKLDVPKAAELLGMLPGPKARRITYAVSQIVAVTPDAVDRIGLSLASQLDEKPQRAFASDPVEHIGEILNFSPASTRDDVLSGLEETDAGLAEQVRRAIFTFADIPDRISPRDIPKVMRDVDQAQLVRALAGAQSAGLDAVADYILENLSARMAESLRDETEEIGEVKTNLAEAAMNDVIAAIRRLETAGEIQIVRPESDDT